MQLHVRGLAGIIFHRDLVLRGELLAEGEIRIACVDTAALRPRRIPDDVLLRLQ